MKEKSKKTVLIVAGALIVLGIALIVIKGFTPEYIDVDGVLHEYFFLLPMGFLFIFMGLISYIVMGIRTLIIKLKK